MEPFLGHRQKPPGQMASPSHIHIFTLATVSSSPVLYVSGLRENVQHRENIQAQHRKTPAAAGTPILHIQNLIILD